MPTFVGPLKCALQLGGDRTAFPSAGFGHVYGATVHAVVVPLEPISEEELVEFCRQYIAGYKLPKAMTFSETELPKSGPGKILAASCVSSSGKANNAISTERAARTPGAGLRPRLRALRYLPKSPIIQYSCRIPRSPIPTIL